MYGLLRAQNWLVDPSCTRLIECLPDLIHDDKRPEDVLKVDAGEGTLGDDAYDSARYGLKSHLDARKEPFEETMRKQLQPISDPTSRAIFAQKLLYDHKRQTPVSHSRARRVWSHR